MAIGGADAGGFLAEEKDGAWSKGEPIPGLAALNVGDFATVNAVSCPSAGNCLVGGSYSTSTTTVDDQAFIAAETDGVWRAAVEVPGTGSLNVGASAEVNAVSCGSAGNCAIGGEYADAAGSEQAFVDLEQDGSWGDPAAVPGTVALNAGGEAGIGAVSCARAGGCAAGGWILDASSNRHAFVVSETSGTWAKAFEVPATTVPSTSGMAAVTLMSCPGPDECVAAGDADDGFTVAQAADGGWKAPHPMPTMPSVDSLSCPAAGDCLAAGTGTVDGKSSAGVIAETNGTWGKAVLLPGAAQLPGRDSQEATIGSVSCASAGNCAAVGSYSYCPSGSCVGDEASGNGFVADEAGGTWGDAKVIPGLAKLTTGQAAAPAAVFCVAPARCVAGGFYDVRAASRPFLVAEMPLKSTSTTLSLSATTVTYGHEQSERASVTVKAGSGVPSGNVTVKAGNVTVCTVTLKSGKGSCTLAASKLKPGSYKLVAGYPGGGDFAKSSSAAKAVTVKKK